MVPGTIQSSPEPSKESWLNGTDDILRKILDLLSSDPRVRDLDAAVVTRPRALLADIFRQRADDRGEFFVCGEWQGTVRRETDYANRGRFRCRRQPKSDVNLAVALR